MASLGPNELPRLRDQTYYRLLLGSFHQMCWEDGPERVGSKYAPLYNYSMAWERFLYHLPCVWGNHRRSVIVGFHSQRVSYTEEAPMS